MISVLIADDELPALEELAFLLGKDARIGAVHRASSGAGVLRLLEQEQVDGIFLDIHMPGLSGLDVARSLAQLPKAPPVVFVTADEDHALKAFELAAVDYLLKPVRSDRLVRAVSRIVDTLAGSHGGQASAPVERPEMIAVTLGGVTRMIDRAEVRFVQAQGDYARLHTEEASYLVRVPLADLEVQWADAGFIRIHRGYLVAMAHVTRLKLGQSSPAVTVGGAEIPVSRRHLPRLRERLEANRVKPSAP
ncbi:LytR/AlgR family response regulator transcription factor [Microterricola pindariensis]|uniref:DNA-binding response regulator n=1 Tax=Microterricola pindariensis TaxID=478010 RepID=A0ABX5AVM7_9MICO|nr:LytTR family DNA-binding domain-containing protein [Microterricola pindariensis]PPL17796.1 DNA-binding response regulator [Microterricola pindariensis]